MSYDARTKNLFNYTFFSSNFFLFSLWCSLLAWRAIHGFFILRSATRSFSPFLKRFQSEMCFYDNWGIEAQYWVLMAITVGKCMVCRYWSNVFYVQSGYLSNKIFFSGWLYRLHIAGSACFCKGGFGEGKHFITICDYLFCNDEFSISVNTVSNILLFELSPLLLSRLKAWALGSPISPFSMLRTSKVTWQWWWWCWGWWQ